MAIYKSTSVVGTLELLSQVTVNGRPHWDCRCCKCGIEKRIREDHLIRYVRRDCGCRPQIVRHGHSGDREYRIWTHMIERCHNENADNFRYYGGVGRYVCQRWRESYEAFLSDMGRAPSEGHTLDRQNTNGSYTCGKCDQCKATGQPTNVQWATKEIQHRNQKSNRHYAHNGQTLILKDWARVSGINYLTLHQRLGRGWSFEDAISTPALPSRKGRPNRVKG